MLKTKTFNYRDNVLDFGFVELEPRATSTSLRSLASSVKESLIIVDTKGSFILDALKELEEYLNQSERIIVGLTNDKVISELKKNGVQNGFFRSTDEQFETGLVILDKKEAKIVLDINHIYDVPPRYVPEIFAYVNHVIWSKANYEQCQGSLKKVEEARLSVVVPPFLDDIDINSPKYVYATESENHECETLIIHKEKEVNRKAKVSPFVFNGIGLNADALLMNAFGNNYYPVPISDGSLFTSETFEKATLKSLSGKRVWVKGKWFDVIEKATSSKTVYVPLDQVNSYQPEFGDYEKEYDGMALELLISVDVKPIKLDNSYALSNRYKVIQRVENELNESISKLEKLELDKKLLKQLESIKAERLLINKVKMFNDFVSSKDFGVEALNNKKSPVSTININETDLIVPNELIGKLYTKNNKNYLATTESRLEDALKWLKENKMEATLIEA